MVEEAMQPGLSVSCVARRGHVRRREFLNYAVWKAGAHFRAAFLHPDFHNAPAAYPPSAMASPHVFGIVAAPSLCSA